MKKAITLILAAALLLSLAACSGINVKSVKLEDIVSSSTGVEKVYCLEYDKDYTFSKNPSFYHSRDAELPESGIVYVIAYKRGDYEVVSCQSNGKKVYSMENNQLTERYANASGTNKTSLGRDLDFLTECLEGALVAAVTDSEQTTNEWYMFTNEEVEAIK
jgi:hypothetical protein